MNLAPIHSQRLTLRALSERDLGVVFEILSDQTTTAEIFRQERSIDETKHWLTCRLEDERKHGASVYAVEHRELQRVIGLCGFFPRSALELELGYVISAGFSGRGFATEAVAAAVRVACREGYRVQASVRPQHDASLRVIEKVGLFLIGKQRDDLGELLLYCSSPPERR